MQRVIESLHSFQRETFGDSRELLNYSSYKDQQRSGLLITCADAGLLAEQSSRNRPDKFHCATGLGAFIPTPSTTDIYDSDSIVATIEYAVRVLRISDVIVRGIASAIPISVGPGAVAGSFRPIFSSACRPVSPGALARNWWRKVTRAQ